MPQVVIISKEPSLSFSIEMYPHLKGNFMFSKMRVLLKIRVSRQALRLNA